ncbi:hypothetical protein P8A18_03125 [Streptomyces castrisilvae]|uniref:Integral membrane protein n=1 Tax=Streptomyces castrisilvae TaxID=3033811 RepID=A0ABY9HEH0_9ACTN|nr:hypothetical protein [Streptomyces sp. Mut1]WLQ32502.1 hypothetical protein P8A18_03125 [Streptomyces sp. Mut1]
MDHRTAPAPAPPVRAAARSRTRRDGTPRIERLCHATGALLIGSGLLHLFVLAVDGGPWEGPVSWRKPITFGVSFGPTLLAVVWISSYLRMGARLRAVLLGVFAADCVLEVAGITVQAWRGVPSHFNMETPFDTAVSMSLAFGGAVLVAVLSTLTAAAFARRPDGPAGMALALRAGFAILGVGLLSGAAMIARGVYLTRTGHQLAGYASTAPLKPLHGVSLHAVLVLPVLARVLDTTSWSTRTRLRAVRTAVGAYALAVAAALVWAAATY